MMRKEAKILIIGVSLSILGVIGYVVSLNVEEDKYPLVELQTKYPLISDLNSAVVSGEIDYDRLPNQAKKSLDYYTSHQIDEPGIIKELKP